MIATLKRPLTSDAKGRGVRAGQVRADAQLVQKLRGMQATGLRRRIAGDAPHRTY